MLLLSISCSGMSNSLQPHGLQPTTLLCPWDSPGKNYWSWLPFPFPGDLSNPGFKPTYPVWQVDSLPLSHWEAHHSLRAPIILDIFSSVQLLSHVWLFATPWITTRQASLSITNSQSLPKLMSIESVMPSSQLILCRPLLPLPPIPPSVRVFSNESTLRMRWPKYWSFSFNISPSNEHPGLISFRMDWLDLLAVHGTLKSLLQHHSSKASIFQHSAFFTVQLTSIHDYWKNHSLD